MNKPFNNGNWTEARFRGFIVSAMRHASMKWQPKHDAVKAAFIGHGINPTTGRRCKLHLCAECGEQFPQSQMRADHIEPVIDPAIGFTSWDDYINRMFVEVDGYQAICIGCHKIKTDAERAIRTETRRRLKALRNKAVRKRTRRTPRKQGP